MADDKRKMILPIVAKDKTKKGTKSAVRNMKKIATAARGAAGAVARIGLVGAAVAAGGLLLMVKRSLEVNDALGKTADRLGITTEALAGMHHVAELTGGSIQGMNTGLQMMSRNVAEAATGTGLAKDALIALGLSADDLRKSGPEEAFKQIVAKLETVDNALDRTGYAMDIFGRSGAAVINITSEALAEATIEADELGLALSRADVAKIEAANDAVLRMSGAFAGAANTLTVELAPLITAVTTEFVEAAKGVDGFSDKIISFTETALVTGARVGDVWRGWSLIFSGVGVAWQALQAGILSGFEVVDRGITNMLNNDIRQINFLVEQINKIPGVTVPLISSLAYSDTIGGMAASAREELALAVADFETLALKKLPSDSVKEWIEGVKAAADEAAASIAATAAGRIDAGSGGSATTGQVSARDDFDAFAFRLMSEEEQLDTTYTNRLEKLQGFHDNGIIGVMEFTQQEALLKEEHEALLSEIKQKGLTDRQKFEALSGKKQIAFASSHAAMMTNGLASTNKAMFDINKVAKISEATMELPAGVSKTWNAYPYPWNIPMAGLHLATGLANIKNIASSSYGGGAGSSSLPSASAPASITAPTLEPVAQPTATDSQILAAPSYNIHVYGNIVDHDQFARELIEPLETARLDGVAA